MRISDWSSDVCSSDLFPDHPDDLPGTKRRDDDAAMLHRHAMRHAIVERPKGGIEQKNAGASHWPSLAGEWKKGKDLSPAACSAWANAPLPLRPRAAIDARNESLRHSRASPCNSSSPPP